MKVSAIIQARYNSKRLKGKILKNILNKPLIEFQIERLKKSKYLKSIIVATTKKKSDNKLSNFCKKLNVKIFRGDEKDVLCRVYNAANINKVDIIVECYGDSPLIDVKLMDKFIHKFTTSNYEVVTNCLKRTFPAGQEISIYKKKTLFKLNNLLKRNDPLREHVSFNFFRFKKKFHIYNITSSKKLFLPNCYLEVDTKKDLIFLNKILKKMSYQKKELSLQNIIMFLKKNKKYLKINNKVNRKWKEVYSSNITI